MMLGTFIVMVVCFSIVGYATFWQSKRTFNRKNGNGVELFENHAAMVKTRIFEGAVFLGGILVGIVGLISAFMFAIALMK